MSRWTPCKRAEFIRKLRQLGFDGPFSGTRHQSDARRSLPGGSEGPPGKTSGSACSADVSATIDFSSSQIGDNTLYTSCASLSGLGRRIDKRHKPCQTVLARAV